MLSHAILCHAVFPPVVVYAPRMPNFSSAFTPPGCSNSPTMRSGSLRLFSSNKTLRPCLPNATAAAHPTMPAPTMTTSASWCSRLLSSRVSVVCVASSMVGTEAVEAPLARNCECREVTPGGSSVILVPEFIVNMVVASCMVNLSESVLVFPARALYGSGSQLAECSGLERDRNYETVCGRRRTTDRSEIWRGARKSNYWL